MLSADYNNPYTSLGGAQAAQSFNSGGTSLYGGTNPLTGGNGQSVGYAGQQYGIGGHSTLQNPLGAGVSELGEYGFPLAAQQEQFAGSLEPQRESTIDNYLQGMGPAANAAQVQTYGNSANQRAGDSAMQQGFANQAQGIGAGTTAGQTANAYNSAANQTNQYQAQLNSPQYKQQQLQAALSAIVSGQSSPEVQQYLALNQSALGNAQYGNQLQNQQNAQSNMLGGLLGPLAGSLGQQFGSSLSGLFSGGGGAAAGTSGLENILGSGMLL